jgi:hypothetical protein
MEEGLMKWTKWDLSSRRTVPLPWQLIYPSTADSYRQNGLSAPAKRVDLFFDFLQFRTIEVTALEKRQRDFQNASLAGFEFKLLVTLGDGATRQEFFFAERELVLRPDDDPNTALRAGDA